MIQAIALQEYTDSETYKYIVVDGRRRYLALQALNIKEIVFGKDAIIVEGDQDLIAFIANEERLQLSLAEQISKIATMLKKGYNLEKLADDLGRSPSWIAKRVNLLKLSELWKKAIDENAFPRLTIGHYEEVAKLPVETQNELYEILDNSYEIESVTNVSVKEWKEYLNDEFAIDLTTLPWEENGCGECTYCKARQGGSYLFEDITNENARCANKEYIQKKEEEYILSKLEDNPQLQLIGSRGTTFQDNEVQEQYKFKITDEPNENTKVALILDGKNKYKEVHIEMHDYYKKGNEQNQAKIQRSLSEKKELKYRQRKRHAIDKLIAYIDNEDYKLPSHEVIVALAAAYGISSAFNWSAMRDYNANNPDNPLLLNASINHLDTILALANIDEWIWQQVKNGLRSELNIGQSGTNDAQYTEAEIISKLIDFDLPTAYKAAEEALPDPKSWAILEAQNQVA